MTSSIMSAGLCSLLSAVFERVPFSFCLVPFLLVKGNSFEKPATLILENAAELSVFYSEYQS